MLATIDYPIRDYHSKPMKFRPSINVYETDDDYILDVFVPGLKKSQIDINVNNGILFITGHPVTHEKNYISKEISIGEFERKLKLSDDIDTEGIGAVCKDGVLVITLHKKMEQKSIKIK